MTLFINYIVCLSNLYALLPIVHSINNGTNIGTLLTINAMIASMLMHISETKHGLVGVAPFNRLSTLFLNYDRVSANLLFVYIVYITVNNGNIVSLLTTISPYSYLGVTCLFLSEKVLTHNVYFFAVTHVLWHIFAFHCQYLLQLTTTTTINTHYD
jgi:hypothetical protein